MTAPAASQSRASGRKAVLVLAAAAAVLILVTLLARPPSYARGASGDPENPEPSGAMAAAEMLRSHEVDVRVLRSTSAVLAASPEALVISNPAVLTHDQLTELAQLELDTVIIGARRAVAGFADDLRTVSGGRSEEIPPGCDDPRAQAGPISTAAGFLTAPGAQACFPGGDNGAMLTWERASGARVTVIPADVLRNDRIEESANAALAMRVLGERANVTWLVGDAADPYGRDDLAPDLSLEWLVGIFGCLLLALIWWRGPRFGRLVAEPLPVVVDASETTIGRGHLYRRSGDYDHAAQALRLAALHRIASRIGLPRHASREEVLTRVTAAAGADAARVQHLLYGPAPTSSRSLHALALSLDALEDEVDSL